MRTGSRRSKMAQKCAASCDCLYKQGPQLPKSSSERLINTSVTKNSPLSLCSSCARGGGDSLLVFNEYVVSMERVSHTSGGAGQDGGTQKILPLVLQLLFPDACHQHMAEKRPQASLRGSYPSQFILPTFFVLRVLNKCCVLNKRWGWQTFGNGCHYHGELSWQWVNTQGVRIKMLRMDLERLTGQHEEVSSFTLCEQHKG